MGKLSSSHTVIALCLTICAASFTGLAAATEIQYNDDEQPIRTSTSHRRAETTGSTDHVVYDRGHFAQYNPRNALDMVRQTPGFSLSDGTNRRGFSGTGGNLLIDGLRPSTKNQSVSDILSRIPADQVMRIELLRGAAVAGDPSGASILLNVVREPSVGSGIWNVGAEYGATPDIAPRGEVAYSGRYGLLEYGVSASVLTRFREDDAYRRVFDANSVLVRSVDTPEARRSTDRALNGDFAMPLWGGRFGGNVQLSFEDAHSRRRFETSDASGALLFTQQSKTVSDEIEGEIGVNYDRSVGTWDVSLLGIMNREDSETEDVTVRSDDAGVITRNTIQDRAWQSGETILRATAATSFRNHLVEFGVEGAFNTLEQQLTFLEDTGIGIQPIPVPNSNIRVEEERADLFASHTWTVNERWSVDTRMAWETSTLTFTGDAEQSVDLSFWKPSLRITHATGNNNQFHFRIYRDVGQLSFGNFVSAVSIAENRINGGNPDLKPTTSWRTELGGDFRFENDAAFSLTLMYHKFADVEDQVLIVDPGKNPGEPPIRFVAPGNIGDGERIQMDVAFLHPLDFILPGAQIDLKGSRQRTEVRDPITGQPREISGMSGISFNFGFRHDLPDRPLAWGFNWEKGRKSKDFRYDEINASSTDAWITAFVETTALPNNMRLRLLVEDIGRRATADERRFFDPDRTGVEDGFELRHLRRSSAPWILLELSGRF